MSNRSERRELDGAVKAIRKTGVKKLNEAYKDTDVDATAVFDSFVRLAGVFLTGSVDPMAVFDALLDKTITLEHLDDVEKGTLPVEEFKKLLEKGKGRA